MLESFGNLTGSLEFLVSQVLPPLGELYREILLPLAKWVIESTAPDSVNALSDAITALGELVGPVLRIIVELLEAFYPVFESIFKSISMMLQSVGGAFTKLAGVFGMGGGEIEGTINSLVGVIEWAAKIIGAIIETVAGLVTGAFNAAVSVVVAAVEWLFDLLNGRLATSAYIGW